MEMIEINFEKIYDKGVLGSINLPDQLKGDFIWKEQTIALVGVINLIEIRD